MKGEEALARALRGIRPDAAARIARILATEKEFRQAEIHEITLKLTKRELELLIYLLSRLGKGREARVVGVGVLAVNDMLLQIAEQGIKEAANVVKRGTNEVLPGHLRPDSSGESGVRQRPEE